jgi:hypothetical protein
MFFLFATATSYPGCSFGGVDTNNWIQINALLLLIAISLGAVFYAFSNILPPSQSEKMKGMVKAEIFQGMIGIFIVAVLVSSAFTWCNIGISLTSSSGITTANPMAFSESYLQNLLFTKGLSLFGSIYSETALLMINGIVLQHVLNFVQRIEASYLPVQIILSERLADALQSYAIAFGSANLSIFSIIAGIIFVIYLVLPVVSSIALTVVVPTAIAMRMLSFLGPRIREASDAFLAIAIAAYFIFPLMIVMNSMLINFIYTPCTATVSTCNPYSTYLGQYKLSQIPADSLFNTPPASLGSSFSISKNFFEGIITSQNGLLGTFGSIFTNAFLFPQVVISFAQEIALFAFQGVFLIGLDILVTIVFAQAVAKGLNSVSVYVSGGGFWG